jgi:hypothetical protein
VARWGLRGIEHLTAEALVPLHQKLDGVVNLLPVDTINEYEGIQLPEA